MPKDEHKNPNQKTQKTFWARSGLQVQRLFHWIKHYSLVYIGSGIGNLVGVGLVLVITVTTLAFVGARLAHVRGVQPRPWCQCITDLVAKGIFGLDETSEADILEFLGWFLALAAIVLAIIPVLGYFRHRRQLQDASVIDVLPVFEREEDDLRHMYRYFRNADEITIFSGDFDWIPKDEKLRQLLVELAEKKGLTLVSYKSHKEVECAWKKKPDGDQTLRKLKECFRFFDSNQLADAHRPLRMKFSLICAGRTQWSCISLVPNCPRAGRDANVGVQSIKGTHASAIIDIVQKLCDATGYQKFKKWPKNNGS